MSNNACFIQYYFSIIPFAYNSNIAECLTNRNKNKLFVECFNTIYDVNLFQNRIKSKWFNSSFNLRNFSVNLVRQKVTDFQGIKDFSLIFFKIPPNNFPLIRLSRSDFFPINGLWFIIIKTFTYNLTNIFVFDYP